MNLTLGFPAHTQEQIAARQTGLAGAIERFEEWMAKADSPVRAIRRQAARPGEFADFPETLAPSLQQALIARGIGRLYTRLPTTATLRKTPAGRFASAPTWS
jgi:hypothetical protein